MMNVLAQGSFATTAQSFIYNVIRIVIGGGKSKVQDDCLLASTNLQKKQAIIGKLPSKLSTVEKFLVNWLRPTCC